eukprot:3974634-Amphidinium_carterae.1
MSIGLTSWEIAHIPPLDSRTSPPLVTVFPKSTQNLARPGGMNRYSSKATHFKLGVHPNHDS